MRTGDGHQAITCALCKGNIRRQDAVIASFLSDVTTKRLASHVSCYLEELGGEIARVLPHRVEESQDAPTNS